MKDSGIDWIGEIPNNWNICRVKNIYKSKKIVVGEKSDEFERLSLTLNGVIKRSKESNDGLQPEEFKGYQILYENELVFKLIDLENIKTSRVGLSPYTGIVSPAYITLSNTLHTKYGYYFFLSLWHRNIFNALTGDGVRGNLSAKDLLNLEYPLVTLEEQEKITRYLNKKVAYIDNIIEKTKESIEEYKKFKLSIITETVTKGLNPDVKMKDSGIEWIGQIPEHWEVLPIKNLLNFNKGLSITKEDLTEDGVSVISYGQIHSKDNKSYKINPDLIRFIPISHPQISQNERVKPGEFIFADTSEDLVGTGNFILNDGMEPLYSGYHTILLKPKNENQVLSKYLSFLFLSESWRAQIRSRVSGIKLFSLTQRIFRSSMIIIPPAAECELIASYLENKLNRIEKIVLIKEGEVQELEQYKKSLIYEVVTGKKEIDRKEVN